MIVQPTDGGSVPAFSYLSAIYRIILRGNQSSNLLTIVEELVYDGDASRCHYHTKEDETITVLNGSLQFYDGGYQFCAPAGASSKPVHIQLLFSPSNIENYLDELKPVLASVPVNTTLAGELSRKYGVVHLNDVDWKDLKFAFNNATLHQLSFYLLFVLIFYFVSIFN